MVWTITCAGGREAENADEVRAESTPFILVCNILSYTGVEGVEEISIVLLLAKLAPPAAAAYDECTTGCADLSR